MERKVLIFHKNTEKRMGDLHLEQEIARALDEYAGWTVYSASTAVSTCVSGPNIHVQWCTTVVIEKLP